MKFGAVVRIASVVGLIVMIGTAYVAYRRTSANDKVRETNEAIAAAVKLSSEGVAVRSAFTATMTEATFRDDRNMLTTRGQAAAAHSLSVATAFAVAADKADEAIAAAENETARTYWSTKRQSLVAAYTGATAAAEVYQTATDPTTPDLATLRARMTPAADRAEAARALADRLNSEAEKFAAEHRGKF